MDFQKVPRALSMGNHMSGAMFRQPARMPLSLPTLGGTQLLGGSMSLALPYSCLAFARRTDQHVRTDGLVLIIGIL